MKEKVFTIILAAVVGAIVGATTVFLIPQKSKLDNHFDEITVKKINISDTLYLWPEGKDDPDLVMTQGGILARTRLIATQLCGNVLVGNAIFTTPDNPQNQIDQCRIFTEMGSNPVTGGGLIVRSVRGANMLSKAGVITQGHSYNIGFDEKEGLMGYSLDNSTQERAVMGLYRSTPHAQQSAQPGQQPAVPTGDQQEGVASTAAAYQQPYSQQYQQPAAQPTPPMVAQPPMESPRN